MTLTTPVGKMSHCGCVGTANSDAFGVYLKLGTTGECKMTWVEAGVMQTITTLAAIYLVKRCIFFNDDNANSDT